MFTLKFSPEFVMACIEADLTIEETIAFVHLNKHQSTDNLIKAWRVYTSGHGNDFTEDVEDIIGETVIMCESCGEPEWEDESRSTTDGPVCPGCYDNRYSTCESCEDVVSDDNTTMVGDCTYCGVCLDRYAHWCESCEEYYHDNDSSEHEHGGCKCEAPVRKFNFPADGHGTVREDERLTVELPKGVVDPQGLIEVSQILWQGPLGGMFDVDLERVLEEVGPTWQTKKGNFTRRLSSALYKLGKDLGKEIKLDAATISAIGNVARQHSSEEASWDIEFTRNLNLPAEDFCHEDSCWWTSYSESRCCLKNHGGVGMRSFNGRYVNGRAWIQPILVKEDGKVIPTHRTLDADGYIVFNGYDNLAGYPGARIVAHLTGNTYRAIAFDMSDSYVNGDKGYLVAPEAICAEIDSVYLSLGSHDQCDAATLTEELVTV